MIKLAGNSARLTANEAAKYIVYHYGMSFCGGFSEAGFDEKLITEKEEKDLIQALIRQRERFEAFLNIEKITQKIESGFEGF